MKSKQGCLVNGFQLLDALAAGISPMAILAFLVLVIVLLDGFGQHVTFLGEIDRYGVDVTGKWYAPDPGDTLTSVELPHADGEWDAVTVALKYYRPETLAALQDGQAVRVRYAGPPAIEKRAVLLDAYDQVQGYSGYFGDVFWPMLVMWAILVLRPDFLYLGLVDIDTILPGKKAA